MLSDLWLKLENKIKIESYIIFLLKQTRLVLDVSSDIYAEKIEIFIEVASGSTVNRS